MLVEESIISAIITTQNSIKVQLNKLIIETIPLKAISLVSSTLVVKLRRYQVVTPQIETTNNNPYQSGGYATIYISTIGYHFDLSKEFDLNIVGHNAAIVVPTNRPAIPILVLEVQELVQQVELLLEY